MVLVRLIQVYENVRMAKCRWDRNWCEEISEVERIGGMKHGMGKNQVESG